MKLHIGEGKILQTIVGEQKQTDQTGQEKSYDLNRLPWPFETDSVDEIRIENVLETVDDVVEIMEEIHRICKNGSKVFIIVPFFHSSSANSNPENKNAFNFATFDYFTKEGGKTDKNFKIVTIKGIPHRLVKWIPNFRLPFFIARNKFIKFRDGFSYFIGEINQYLYVELIPIKE